jgi:cytochrome b
MGRQEDGWDVPVRVTHWLLVVSVAGAYASSRSMAKLLSWHKYRGYAILILVTFRMVWGFVGTRYARFGEFLRGPRDAARYFRELCARASPKDHVGHSPLGGWSVITMLVLLLAQASTGLFANDDISKVGPFFGWVSNFLSNTMTELHHRFFIALKALIGLHILAIAYYRFAKRVDLLTPMITGLKSAALVPDSKSIHGSRLLLALSIVVILTIALWAGLAFAPKTSLSIF